MFDPVAVGEVPTGKSQIGVYSFMKYIRSADLKEQVPSFPDSGKEFLEVHYIKARNGTHLVHTMVPKSLSEACEALGVPTYVPFDVTVVIMPKEVQP